jgi:AraC-like DNA-binding protein
VLSAALRFVREPVELVFDLALEDTFRVYRVLRRGTLWDARLAPAHPDTKVDAAFVYVVLGGTLAWDAPLALQVGPGQAMVASQAALDGAGGVRTATYASWGEPFHVVQVRVARELVAMPVPEEGARAFEPSAALLAAARAYASAPEGDEARRRALTELLRALHEGGVLASDLSTTMRGVDALGERVWRAAVPIFRDLYFSPSLVELSDRAGLSLRHMGRAVSGLTRRFDLPWEGWRDIGLGMRLGIALLLLSNEAIPVGEVAERTGYGSVEALHHALRAAGVPSPTESRRRLLARRRELGA